MELYLRQIKKILNKKSGKFKLCKICKCVNYYTNTECFSCGSSLFEFCDDEIKKEIDINYEIFREQGLSDKEIDRILIRIK